MGRVYGLFCPCLEPVIGRPLSAWRFVSRDKLECTQAVHGGACAFHIVKNYTGDIMNFEMGADLTRADGIEVEAAVTNDDVAVKHSPYTSGRRGVGVTVLAEKIAGAAAEQRRPLKFAG
jgi:phosphoenolpyruvate---glycerone phosphotransferase subunit DhaK